MTVVAYRDSLLAADRRIHKGDVATWGTMTKIARSPSGAIRGSYGQSALVSRFVDRLHEGETGFLAQKASVIEEVSQ